MNVHLFIQTLIFDHKILEAAHPTITFSKGTIETLEQCVKCVQS